MRGTKRLVALLTVMAAALLLASGVALAATLRGTNSADTLDGTAQDDNIYGYDGHDTIRGLGGYDYIDAGLGNDTVRVSDEDDSYEEQLNRNGSIHDNAANGSGGDDTIIGSKGADRLSGGSGNDTIDGRLDADTIYGSDGDDDITAGPEEETSEDKIYGEAGNDTIRAANTPASKDIVDCGTGDSDAATVDSLDVVSSNCEILDQAFEGSGGTDALSDGSGNTSGNGGDPPVLDPEDPLTSQEIRELPLIDPSQTDDAYFASSCSWGNYRPYFGSYYSGKAFWGKTWTSNCSGYGLGVSLAVNDFRGSGWRGPLNVKRVVPGSGYWVFYSAPWSADCRYYNGWGFASVHKWDGYRASMGSSYSRLRCY